MNLTLAQLIELLPKTKYPAELFKASTLTEWKLFIRPSHLDFTSPRRTLLWENALPRMNTKLVLLNWNRDQYVTLTTIQQVIHTKILYGCLSSSVNKTFLLPGHFQYLPPHCHNELVSLLPSVSIHLCEESY